MLMKQTLIVIGMLFCTTVFCQIKATTDDGKRVILNNDGSWKFDETSSITETKVSYECSDLIETKVDKVSGQSGTSAKESVLITKDGKNGIGCYLMVSKGTIIFSLTVVGAGSCIDDTDKINILFRDGTRMELVNNGKYNCEKNFTLYFGTLGGKRKELEALKTKEIETMRVWTTDSYVQEDLTPENSKALMKIFECLSSAK